jgi:hypothetical protein
VGGGGEAETLGKRESQSGGVQRGGSQLGGETIIERED